MLAGDGGILKVPGVTSEEPFKIQGSVWDLLRLMQSFFQLLPLSNPASVIPTDANKVT